MIYAKDVHVWSDSKTIDSGEKGFGIGELTVTVRRYVDLKNGGRKLKYLVTADARALVAGVVDDTDGYLYDSSADGFANYPGMVLITSSIGNAKGTLGLKLAEYTPKTANASVSTSSDSGSQNSATHSTEHASGSTSSQSNTFGYSVGLSSSYMDPIGLNLGTTGSFTHTRSHEHSHGSSSSHESSSNSNHGVDLSLKDWVALALLPSTMTDESTIAWTWAQEYPWNIIAFHATDDGTDGVVTNIPDFVRKRLYDGQTVYPPSDLALNGLTAKTTAAWIIEVLSPQQVNNLNITSSFAVRTLSHSLVESADAAILPVTPVELQCSINVLPPATAIAGTLDLDLYALDPLALSLGVINGFQPSNFVYPVEGGDFSSVDDTNQILVRGSGFEDDLSAQLSSTATASLSIFFKVTDVHRNIEMTLKHWRIGNDPVKLTFTINPDPKTKKGVTIVRTVDAGESQGGDHNLTTLILRYKDFASKDFADYIDAGLNQIDVAIEPAAASSSVTYQLKGIGFNCL